MRSDEGFSILELLVAIAVLSVAVVWLAQLFDLSTRANASAKRTTYASLLAQQKMEQLRGLTWGFDALGLPLTDTSSNIAAVPESSTGGPGLAPSPSNSLDRNVDGYCDYVDANGNVLGGCPGIVASASYVRRWSVEPLPSNPNNTIVLQVLVTQNVARGAAAPDISAASRLPNDARVVSVKTRKAS
jgi:prepilin-type N-terminal cleavage/methylation domain-containing protein